MAELGSDNFDQELTLSLLGNEKHSLDQIESAMDQSKTAPMAVARTAVGRSPSPAWTPSPMRHSASDVLRSGKTAIAMIRSSACNGVGLAYTDFFLPLNIVTTCQRPFHIELQLRSRQCCPPAGGDLGCGTVFGKGMRLFCMPFAEGEPLTLLVPANAVTSYRGELRIRGSPERPIEHTPR